MNKKVLLIGDINIDLTLKGIKNISEFNRDLGSEIELKGIVTSIGGSGFNFIQALNSFGIEIDLYGKIGNDIFGNYIKTYLKEKDIENSLIISDEINTGFTEIIPIESDRILLTYNGSNADLNIDDLDLARIKNFSHVHFSSYYLLKGLQPSIIQILKFLKSNNITVSFDTGFDPDENWQREKIFSILKYVDVFIPNEVEALSIVKSKNIDNALDVLSIHCPIVVIKLGQKGLIGKINSIEKKILRIPSYNINVLDTTCCGDCFDAGFLYSYLNGFSFEESLRFGNACGGLQATKLGSYKFKNIKEIKEFVNNNNLREENNAKI